MTELNQLRGKNPSDNSKSSLLVNLVGCRPGKKCNGMMINSWTLATASICVSSDFPYPRIKVQYSESYPQEFYNINQTIHRYDVAIAKVSSFTQ